jgi:hypothetical protein
MNEFLPIWSYYLVFGILALAIYGSFLQLIYGYMATNWPKATGIITKSEMEFDHREDRIDYFKAIIEYEYVVDGRKYSYCNYDFQNSLANKSCIESRLTEFPLESSVQIYYKRNSPNISVLKPGVKPLHIIVPALVLFFTGAAIVLMFPKFFPQFQ